MHPALAQDKSSSDDRTHIKHQFDDGFQFELHWSVAAALCELIQFRITSCYGLLLGTVSADGRVIIVDDHLPGIAERCALHMSLEQWRRRQASPVSVVGCYGLAGQDKAKLPDIFALAAESISSEHLIGLQIRPCAQGFSAEAFAHPPGSDLWRPMTPKIQVQFKGELPARAAEVQAIHGRPARGRFHFGNRWLLGGVIVAVGVSSLGLGLFQSRWLDGLVRSAPREVVVSHEDTPGSPFSLNARADGSNILFSWNSQSPGLRQADSAVLVVTSGDEVRTVLLDRAAIDKQRFSVLPAGKELEVRLQSQLSADRVLSEVLRIATDRPRADLIFGASAASVARTSPPVVQTSPAQTLGKGTTGTPAEEARPNTLRAFEPPKSVIKTPLPLSDQDIAMLDSVSLAAGTTVPRAAILPPTATPLPEAPRAGQSEVQDQSRSASPLTSARVVKQGPIVLPPGMWAYISPETTIVLQVKIAADGKVHTVTPEQYEGVRGEAARRVSDQVRRWTFAPATLDSRAVPSDLQLSVRLRSRRAVQQ